MKKKPKSHFVLISSVFSIINKKFLIARLLIRLVSFECAAFLSKSDKRQDVIFYLVCYHLWIMHVWTAQSRAQYSQINISLQAVEKSFSRIELTDCELQFLSCNKIKYSIEWDIFHKYIFGLECNIQYLY